MLAVGKLVHQVQTITIVTCDPRPRPARRANPPPAVVVLHMIGPTIISTTVKYAIMRSRPGARQSHAESALATGAEQDQVEHARAGEQREDMTTNSVSSGGMAESTDPQPRAAAGRLLKGPSASGLVDPAVPLDARVSTL